MTNFLSSGVFRLAKAHKMHNNNENKMIVSSDC